MTFDEYQKAALVTAAAPRIGDVEMCVRTLGLCGELVELKDALFSTNENEIKEGGDVLWYAATLAEMFGLNGAKLGVIDLDDFDMIDFANAPKTVVVDRAIEAAGKLAELVKKQVGHGKPANVIKVGVLLQTVITAVNAVMPVGLGVVARTNVDKLRARYPQGFDKAIASVKPDSDECVTGRVVLDETEAAARRNHMAPTSHFPEGSMHFDETDGEWKPGPV